MTNPSFEAFKAAANASPHTDLGPVRWFGYAQHNELTLATERHGRRYVMDFVRWGMKSGQPRFQVYEPKAGGLPGTNGLMVEAKELLDASDRGEIHGINHPDAVLIAATFTHSRAVVAHVERLEAALRELVDLKMLKDADGKTPDYAERQPKAWSAALDALGVPASPGGG